MGTDHNADGDYADTESGSNPDGTWFSLTDVQFSVVALMTDLAELTERVAFDAYGRARHRWFSDLDGDGDSDVTDFYAQYAAQATTIHNTGYRPDADHDRDGDVDNTDYYAFLSAAGQAALPYGLISDPLGADNPIGYDGYVFAPEAGLNAAPGSPQPQAAGAYCVRFRWYLPELGRWLERDPAGYVDGLALYMSMRSSPISNGDAFGLCADAQDCASDDLNICQQVLCWIGGAFPALPEAGRLSKAHDQSGIEALLTLYVQSFKESTWNPNANAAPLSSGLGLMQILNGTKRDIEERVWRRYVTGDWPIGEGIEGDWRLDPSTAIMGGYVYLLDRIAANDSDVEAGLDAYGEGPGYGRVILEGMRALKHFCGTDPNAEMTFEELWACASEHCDEIKELLDPIVHPRVRRR